MPVGLGPLERVALIHAERRPDLLGTALGPTRGVIARAGARSEKISIDVPHPMPLQP